MNKRYNNKTNYEPARFRHRVSFWRDVSTEDRSGGQSVTQVGLLETWAIQEKIREGSQLAITLGLSSLNEDKVYVIRYRCGFYPEKDMRLKEFDTFYTIVGIVPVDDPNTYVKLFCKRVS